MAKIGNYNGLQEYTSDGCKSASTDGFVPEEGYGIWVLGLSLSRLVSLLPDSVSWRHCLCLQAAAISSKMLSRFLVIDHSG